jgi:hypothetical protein
MKRNILYLFSALILGSLSFAGCAHKEGPAERTGEAIDEALEDDGPVEETGEAIDEAFDDE